MSTNEDTKTDTSPPGHYSLTIEHDEKAGEFEQRCPMCDAVGAVHRDGVVCMQCHVVYIQFVHEINDDLSAVSPPKDDIPPRNDSDTQ